MTTSLKASSVQGELKKLGSTEKAAKSAWFFKTGEGEYGFGDKFYGVTVPEQRAIAKEFKELAINEIKKLLQSPMHECRATALHILCIQFKSADEKTRKAIQKFYLDNRSRINNWDLVDASARNIVGEYLVDKDRAPLYRLAKSKVMWDRRIAIVATHAFIMRDDFTDTIAISKILLTDTEDLMHKATGWMLREMGKRSKNALIGFLDEHAHEMPRTMLRYSLEKLSAPEKKKYMQAKALRSAT